MRFALLVGVLLPVTMRSQRGPRPLTHPTPRARPERSESAHSPAARQHETDDQIDRLEKMSPAERQSALETLPKERRDRIEKRLAHLQSLTPEQRTQLQERLKRFKKLGSTQQQQVRQIAQAMQQLPPDRKVAIRQELGILRSLPNGERQSRVQSSTWQKQFSPKEQEILKQSTELFPEQL